MTFIHGTGGYASPVRRISYSRSALNPPIPLKWSSPSPDTGAASGLTREGAGASTAGLACTEGFGSLPRDGVSVGLLLSEDFPSPFPIAGKLLGINLPSRPTGTGGTLPRNGGLGAPIPGSRAAGAEPTLTE